MASQYRIESSSLFARSIFVETPVALVVAGVFVFPIRWGGAVEVGERDADLGAETQAPGKAMALPNGVAVVGCGDVEPPAIPEARTTRFGCGTASGLKLEAQACGKTHRAPLRVVGGNGHLLFVKKVVHVHREIETCAVAQALGILAENQARLVHGAVEVGHGNRRSGGIGGRGDAQVFLRKLVGQSQTKAAQDAIADVVARGQ